ncbi:hypothetical protein D3C76_1677310 [compost metagenome]
MPAALILIPALLQRHFFQFADVQRAVVIKTGAVVLTLVIADMPGNGWQGVTLINQLQRIGIALFAQQPDIFRDILFNGAGGDARSHVTVNHRQWATSVDAIR